MVGVRVGVSEIGEGVFIPSEAEGVGIGGVFVSTGAGVMGSTEEGGLTGVGFGLIEFGSDILVSLDLI